MQRHHLADLDVFATVAREKSFSRAAAQLGVSRSAVSHAMTTLEERLGVRLLTRTTRSVSTTEAGARLLAVLEPRIAEIHAELDSLGEGHNKPAGLVRVSATDSVHSTLLWPRLLPVLQQHPDLQIELQVDYGLTDIVAGRFDAGVRAGDQVARDMIAVLIAPAFRLAVVCSPDHLRNKVLPTTPEQLTQHRCINLRLPTYGGLLPWELQRGAQTTTVRVEGQAIFNSTDQVLQAALDGVGVAFLPWDLAKPHLEAGRLVPLLEEWWPSFPLYLYYPSRKQVSLAFRTVVEALRHRG